MIFRTSLCLLLIVLISRVTECGRYISRRKNNGANLLRYAPTQRPPIGNYYKPITYFNPPPTQSRYQYTTSRPIFSSQYTPNGNYWGRKWRFPAPPTTTQRPLRWGNIPRTNNPTGINEPHSQYNTYNQHGGHGTYPAGVQHGQQNQNPVRSGPPPSNFYGTQNHQNSQQSQNNVIIHTHQHNNYWSHHPPVYTTHDTGTTALGFYLGYSLANIQTPSYVYYNHYYDDMPRYDHYTVHHYYHNRDDVPKEKVIQPNAIVGCTGDSGALCPANTISLCTNNGAVMCVTSVSSTVPCSNEKDTNCVRSVVPCKNNNSPECKQTSHDMVQVSIPCISTAKI